MCQLKLAYKLTSSYEHVLEPASSDFRTLLNQKYQPEPPAIFTAIPYQQNFGKLFAPNLSTLDLIFCEGPGARTILMQTTN